MAWLIINADRSAALAAEQAQGTDRQEPDGARFGNQGEGGGDVRAKADRRARHRFTRQHAPVVLGELHQVDEVDLSVVVEVAVEPPGVSSGIGNKVAAVA